LKQLAGWVQGVAAGFYVAAISFVLLIVVSWQFVEASEKDDFDLGYWEGILGLSFLPVILGFLILFISISGALVSGTRYANQNLADGEKSHNPIWGVLFWFVPIYGLYKSYVMSRSIERAFAHEGRITKKLFTALFLSWVLGIVSEVSSRTIPDPRTVFLLALAILALITAVWFFMAIQTHGFLGDVRALAFALSGEGQIPTKSEKASHLAPKNEGVPEQSTQKFCTNCGGTRSLNSKFCGECGSPFSQLA